MRQHLLLLLCFFVFGKTNVFTQSGCPGCTVQLPAGLAADTLYLQSIPDGERGTPYDQNISFRVPKSTTPVHAVDSTTPPGYPITKIEIVGLEGLPAGLHWEANQLVFETATQTDGCIKICGVPLESDSFVLTVKLKATVVIISQEASFPMRMYIAPKVSTTDGFSMTDYTGCGSTTVSFTNNIPSGGNAGFSYEWDFGDGTTSTDENPASHTYTKSGKYEVNYHATIDTAGYRLLSATVISVDNCSDQLGLGKPDLYLFILNAAGQMIFNSSPEITNASVPLTFPIDIPLGPGSFRLEVWDEDSGLEGADDPCGLLYFNNLNDGDTLVAGGLRVVLNIDHPVDEVQSTDTVQVFPVPVKPSIVANALSACEGSNNIVLQSSFGAGNQWWLDGQPISNATDFLYAPKAGGHYQVQISNMYGCSAFSDSALVTFHPLPAEPKYLNDRNNLELIDTLGLPADYALQWYLFNGPIAGATGFTYCAQMNGEYSLQVTDLNTGCTRVYTTMVTIDPNYDCTLGAAEAFVSKLAIFPNPAAGNVTLRVPQPLPAAGGILRIWDVAGRLAQVYRADAGSDTILLDGASLAPGAYVVEVSADGVRYLGRLVVVR